ncbi:GM18349 [Drosophila sechellia]|uniref:GM18349 n=1 Tax=Drosophila sechellia TaxID=7238 RepID=B4I2M7_DROSE|nr:GM18349 [Drosophila sechellia]
MKAQPTTETKWLQSTGRGRGCLQPESRAKPESSEVAASAQAFGFGGAASKSWAPRARFEVVVEMKGGTLIRTGTGIHHSGMRTEDSGLETGDEGAGQDTQLDCV